MQFVALRLEVPLPKMQEVILAVAFRLSEYVEGPESFWASVNERYARAEAVIGWFYECTI